MNTFELKMWDDEASKCTFYTVRWEDAKLSETDKFFAKYDAMPEFKPCTQVLLSFVLDSIGEDHGAIDTLFSRFENEVVGLPNKGRVTAGEIVRKGVSFREMGRTLKSIYKNIYMRSKIAKKIQDETPKEVRIFIRQYTDIVIRINELLVAKGYTQKDLADKLNKKPSEINKWLKGTHNLTLKTLAKLEAELGEPIIYTSADQLRKKPRKRSLKHIA